MIPCLLYFNTLSIFIEKAGGRTSDDWREAWSQEKEIPGGQWFLPWGAQECECGSLLFYASECSIQLKLDLHSAQTFATQRSKETPV